MGGGFLSWLSPLAPRFYSIASAPGAPNTTLQTDGCTLSIIYKLVQYKCLTHQHFGVATRYLSGLRVGDVVKAEIKSNPNFKLPSDMSTPIIMVGAGTGLAPFISFMQQRIQDAQNALISEDLDGMAFNDMPNSMLKSALNPARNMLFWGDAYQHTDCVKCADLHGWVAAKELAWFAAFSRDQAKKIYVQDVLWQQRELVWQQWQNGAVLYVCGSQTTMAKAVEQTWRAILQSLGGLSQMDADQAWLNAKRQKRIQLDVY
jgi:sulfite reductase (NADPH) flavoprotein alpha-component